MLDYTKQVLIAQTAKTRQKSSSGMRCSDSPGLLRKIVYRSMTTFSPTKLSNAGCHRLRSIQKNRKRFLLIPKGRIGDIAKKLFGGCSPGENNSTRLSRSKLWPWLYKHFYL